MKNGILNGNTLITEGADGRIIEVTPNHELVWEYISPYWGETWKMMIRVSVMYPNEGGNFDMEYYTSKHMALVHKLLESYGLVRTAVDKGIGTAEPGVPPPF